MKLWPDHIDWPLARSHLRQGSCFSGRWRFAKATCLHGKPEKDVAVAYKNLILWGLDLSSWQERKMFIVSAAVTDLKKKEIEREWFVFHL